MKARLEKAERQVGADRPEFCPGCHAVVFINCLKLPEGAPLPPRPPCQEHGDDPPGADAYGSVRVVYVCRSPGRTDTEEGDR